MRKLLLLTMLLSFFVWMAPGPAFAQNIRLDSLENILNTGTLAPGDKLALLDQLSTGYLVSSFEKSKHFSMQGIALADAQNDELKKGRFLRNIGAAYTMITRYDTAAFYLDEAMKIAQSKNDEHLIALTSMSQATIYTRLGQYQKALPLFFKSLAYFEKTGDKKNMRSILANIAALNMYQENFVNAEKYYKQAVQIALELNDGSGLGQSYDGLSRIYFRREQFDSAMQYAKMAAAAFHSINAKSFESVATQQIAVNYLKRRQLTEAEAYAQKALELAKEQGSPRYMADATGLMAEIAWYKKDYATSSNYALEALEIDSTDGELKSRMLSTLLKNSIFGHEPEKAIGFLERYKNSIDARANEQYQESLSEMEVKYDSEKKQLRIDALEKEKKITLLTAITGAVASLLILLLLFFRQRIMNHKKEIAEQKIAQLEQEKKLVATRAVLDGETAERTRLARDLHDSLGGMLSVIKLNLYDVKKGLHIEGADAIRFNQALEMLETSTRELRRVAHNMMPEALSRYGLKTSLRDFIRNIPNAHFHFFGEDSRLEPNLEVMVYRTAYELVNNVLKHADAASIHVQLVQQPDTISLTVQDDGKGFEPGAVSDGQGLQNIRHRVESFGGILNIFSKAAEGTEINVEFKTQPLS